MRTLKLQTRVRIIFLFSEHYVTVSIPELRVKLQVAEADMEPQASPTTAPKQRKLKTLPADARAMHPCMLLTYMRPLQEYRELSVQGDRPQNLVYTIGVEVDGSIFVGQGIPLINAKLSTRLRFHA